MCPMPHSLRASPQIQAVCAFSCHFMIGAGTSSVRTVRIIRTLRPLRAVKRAPSLKVVVDSLWDCVPGFLNVMAVAAIIYLVFAIIGVQFFAGKFWKCNDSAAQTVEDCAGYFTAADGTNTSRTWTNSIQNFDNTANAFLTLFEAILSLCGDLHDSPHLTCLPSPTSTSWRPPPPRSPPSKCGSIHCTTTWTSRTASGSSPTATKAGSLHFTLWCSSSSGLSW